MNAEEALAKCIELGERRQAALDELQAVRYELPRVCEFARRSRGVSLKTVADAVGINPRTVDRWIESGDAVGWYQWDGRGTKTPVLE